MSDEPTDADIARMPPPTMPPEDDFVAEGLTDVLFGATIDYTYSRGDHYRLVFDRDGNVTFLHGDPVARGDGSGPPPGPNLRYRARQLRDGQYLVHWIVKPANIHVSLVIDLTDGRVSVAAMMPPNKWEFFDTATIDAVTYV